MRATRLGIAVVAGAGFLGTSGLVAAQEQSGASRQQTSQQDPQQRQAQGQSQQGSQQAPVGFVLVEERVIVLTANEPQNHFLRAGELFLAGNDQAAAGEVRMGANYIDMQASRAQGEAKKQLTSAAQELRAAAKQLRGKGGQRAQQSRQQQTQGQQQGGEQQDARQAQAQRQQQMQRQMQTEARELLEAFAQANYALAQHFQAKAKSAIENERPVIAGHELNAAADALTAAVTWAGQQVPQEAVQAITSTQQLAARLAVPSDDGQGEAQQAGARQGAGPGGEIPENAKQVVQELGKAIENCGQSIRSFSSDDGKQSVPGSASGTGGGQQNKQQ